MKWIKKGNLKGPIGRPGAGFIPVGSTTQLSKTSSIHRCVVTHNFEHFHIGDILHYENKHHKWVKISSILGPKGSAGAKGATGIGIHGVWSQAELNAVPKTDKAVVDHPKGFGSFHVGDFVEWHTKENKWVKFSSLLGPKGDTGVVHYTDPGTF